MSKNDITQMAKRLIQAPTGAQLDAAANSITEAADYNDLVAAIVALYAASLEDEYAALCKSMELFECICEKNLHIGIRLMRSLMPIASNSFAHDVCDAIDLWIWETREEPGAESNG